MDCPGFSQDSVNFHSQARRTEPANGIFSTIPTSCPVYLHKGDGSSGKWGQFRAATGQGLASAVSRALWVTCFIIISSLLMLVQTPYLNPLGFTSHSFPILWRVGVRERLCGARLPPGFKPAHGLTVVLSLFESRGREREGAVSSLVFVFLCTPELCCLSGHLLSTFWGSKSCFSRFLERTSGCCRRRCGFVSLFWALLPDSKSSTSHLPEELQ